MWVFRGVFSHPEYIPSDGQRIYEWWTRKNLKGRGRVKSEILSEIICRGWKTQRKIWLFLSLEFETKQQIKITENEIELTVVCLLTNQVN